jgi:hypothetical protein
MRVALGRVRHRPLIIHRVGSGGLIVVGRWPGMLLGVALFRLVCLVLVDVMVLGLVGFLLVAAVLAIVLLEADLLRLILLRLAVLAPFVVAGGRLLILVAVEVMLVVSGRFVGGFAGSVPVIVLVLAEQLQGVGGLGEDADGFGTADVYRIKIALPGEDVRDSVDGGFEPDGITGGGAGNDQLQPMLTVAAEPNKPLLGGRGGSLFGADRVRLIDSRVQ